MKQEIAEWNGKSVISIRGIYHRYGHTSLFVSDILSFSKEKAFQKAATWLLKQHLENGACLNPSQVKSAYMLFPGLEHWESKLHVLQCIPYMPIPKLQKNRIKSCLKKWLIDDAKFVRAWAYNGFYELAAQYPEHQEEAKQLFDIALKDEAASVKARIRRILRRGFT